MKKLKVLTLTALMALSFSFGQDVDEEFGTTPPVAPPEKCWVESHWGLKYLNPFMAIPWHYPGYWEYCE